MKKEYLLFIKGNEWNIKSLGNKIDQLDWIKNNYKKYFNLLRVRKNWFGMLDLGLIDMEDNIAISEFLSLLRDKEFRRVYIQALGKGKRNGKEEWCIKITAYDCDMHYVHKVISKILKKYDITCDSVFY